MSTKPEDANDECVGPNSEKAGKVESCKGCPNQNVCSTGGLSKVDPAIKEINTNLSFVKNKILVLSGKGGVGKSTFTAQLALAISNDSDTEVGILDIDLCGPSIPRMFGVEDEELHNSNLGWQPVYPTDNLGVVSIGFMLPEKDSAVIWRGPKKNGLIKQFLRDVNWGDKLDYLLIDTPPGTSDEHLSLVTYLKETGIDGAILVTTPQDVSCQDVKREIKFCKKLKIPIIGIIENMSGFICSKCNKKTMIFKSKSGGGKKLAKDYNIPFLGTMPLDPFIMKSCESGKSIINEDSKSISSTSLVNILKSKFIFLYLKKFRCKN